MIQMILFFIVPSLILQLIINFAIVKTKKNIDKSRYQKRSIQICLFLCVIYTISQIVTLFVNLSGMNNPDANAISIDSTVLFRVLIWSLAIILTQIILNKTLLTKNSK